MTAKRLIAMLPMLAAIVFSTGLEVRAQQQSIPVGCEADTATLAFWRSVRDSAADADANQLILPLADCLRSPNPELRDRIAYEVITYWLRNNKASDPNVSRLRLKLVPWLQEGAGESNGDAAFARAFSALILSEVLRYDATEQSMAGEELFELHKAAMEMFVAERDYRGLTERQGWIHTIAHGADLLWRLGMHPLIGSTQQREVLDALIQQITNSGIPAYTFNESDRLARVVAVIVSRAELTAEEVAAWIERAGSPGDLGSWNQAFKSPAGMAQLHNQKQFLRALEEVIEGSTSEVVSESLTTALEGMP